MNAENSVILPLALLFCGRRRKRRMVNSSSCSPFLRVFFLFQTSQDTDTDTDTYTTYMTQPTPVLPPTRPNPYRLGFEGPTFGEPRTILRPSRQAPQVSPERWFQPVPQYRVHLAGQVMASAPNSGTPQPVLPTLFTYYRVLTRLHKI